jgi:hypothetical protein
VSGLVFEKDKAGASTRFLNTMALVLLLLLLLLLLLPFFSLSVKATLPNRCTHS